MPITPFRLDLELRSPLAGGELPTLDAVLLGELVRLAPAKDPGDNPDNARQILGMLKWRNNIPHASALMFDAVAKNGETIRNTRRPREFDEIGPRNLAVDIGIGRDIRRPKPRSRINHALPANCGAARFIGVGDIDEIERILAHWQGIGAQWRNGWGEISGGKDEGWEITQLTDLPPGAENWWGLLDENGAPARPLPPDMFWSLPGRNPQMAREDNKRAQPPYWGKHPKIPVVVRGEGLDDAQNESASVAEFIDDRFARHMMSEEDRADSLRRGGPTAAANQALKQKYDHDGNGAPQRMQVGVAIVAPDITRLAANRLPQGQADDGKFEKLPAAQASALLFDAAMNQKGRFVAVSLEGQETLQTEHLSFSYGGDFVVVCGREGRRDLGGFSREKIRRILDITRKRELSVRDLKKMESAEHPDLDDEAENDAELRELRRLLFGLSEAGWMVLKAAPQFRKTDGGKK